MQDISDDDETTSEDSTSDDGGEDEQQGEDEGGDEEGGAGNLRHWARQFAYGANGPEDGWDWEGET